MSKATMRKVICFILAIMVLSCSALAVDKQTEIENDSPNRVIGLYNIVSTLKINDNNIATCYSYVRLDNGYSADVTMTLKRAPLYTSNWTDVTNWSASGSSKVEINKLKAVNSGYDYQLEIEVDIYNSSGRLVDSTTDYSDIVSY